jgi:GNAT superfamily N-acetyltransferase
VKIAPLTRARWKDFETLFGKNGACAGCWCQWIRLPAAEYRAIRGEGAKRAMKKLAAGSRTPGLLAYEGRRAVGWIALGPRKNFRRLETSRALKPVDEKPVWSAPCFFVAKEARGNGVTTALLKAASAHARSKGAKIIEGYPVETSKRTADAFLWWGTASAFKKAGFREAARRAKVRPIMRKAL